MSNNSIALKRSRQRRLLLPVIAAVGIMLAAAMAATAAWLLSSDSVTNLISGKNASVALMEPQWLASGMTDANAYLPGAAIKKDPTLKNTGSAAVYFRMRIKITDEFGNELTPESDPARVEKILNSIYFNSTDKLLEAADELQTPVYTPPSRGYNINGKTYYSKNPNYYLAADGYFYYAETADDETKAPVFTVLNADADSYPLFTWVQIPHLQTDYKDSFDSSYRIDVTAQAVPAAAFTSITPDMASMSTALAS